MSENIKGAIKLIEQGHVRVGTELVKDPAFLVTRTLEDFVTWVDSSKIKRHVLEYNGLVRILYHLYLKKFIDIHDIFFSVMTFYFNPVIKYILYKKICLCISNLQHFLYIDQFFSWFPINFSFINLMFVNFLPTLPINHRYVVFI